MLTFYLRDPKAESSPIMCQAYCSDGRLRKAIGKTVPTKWWKDGWIQSKGLPAADRRQVDEIESHLKYLRGAADDIVLKARVRQRPVSRVEISALIDAKPGSAIKGGFLSLFDRVITMAESGELTTKEGGIYSDNTTKTWRPTLNILTEFFPGDIDVDDITIDHLRAFVNLMNKEGQAKNYIGVHVKNWKTAMRHMNNLGWSGNLVYKHNEFVPKFEVVAKPYLTDDEIERVWQLDLSYNIHLDQVRDRWLVMYCTGLRVSDNRRLKLQHFDNQFITLMNEKTGKVVVIPFHRIMVDILEKYNGQLPPNYHDVVINREIKEVGRLAGITDTFTYKETRGGIKREVSKPRYELMSCHTARRSVTTNMQKANIPYEIAGDMLGMSRKTWDHYNKASAKDKAEILQSHSFFTGS